MKINFILTVTSYVVLSRKCDSAHAASMIYMFVRQLGYSFGASKKQSRHKKDRKVIDSVFLDCPIMVEKPYQQLGDWALDVGTDSNL